MTSQAIVLAVLCAVAFAGVALSALALFHVTSATRLMAHRLHAALAQLQAQMEAASDTTRENVEALAAELRDLQQAPAAVPPLPRAGFNLSKRSQALRMHRRGERPDQIAAALEIPLQEVDLLLKVHRIVLSQL